jgi:hypothetical protein
VEENSTRPVAPLSHASFSSLLAAAAAGDKLERRQLGYLLARQGVQLDLEDGPTAVEVRVCERCDRCDASHSLMGLQQVGSGQLTCGRCVERSTLFAGSCFSRTSGPCQHSPFSSYIQNDEECDVLRKIISNSKLNGHVEPCAPPPPAGAVYPRTPHPLRLHMHSLTAHVVCDTPYPPPPITG